MYKCVRAPTPFAASGMYYLRINMRFYIHSTGGFETPFVAINWDDIGVWNVDNYVRVFFHTLYAATTMAIVSSAIAERGDHRAFFAFTIWFSAVVYPFPAYW